MRTHDCTDSGQNGGNGCLRVGLTRPFRWVSDRPKGPYWTDLGDDFARGYDLAAAYALYDVALSLPMPDAQRGNAVLAGKRNVAARLRSDFPAFFLPK